MKLHTRLQGAVVVAVAAAALVPASANAATTGLLGNVLRPVTNVVNAVANPCAADAPVAKVFAAWGDQSNYKLSPGGDFETGAAGWTLTGGARVVDGDATAKIGAATDDSSLELPAGASATSPASCVSLQEPTFRMFASGSAKGSLRVQAVYDTTALSAGVIGAGAWSPSAIMPSGGGLAGRTFSVRVTNTSSSTMKIDDVYIDPYRRS